MAYERCTLPVVALPRWRSRTPLWASRAGSVSACWESTGRGRAPPSACSRVIVVGRERKRCAFLSLDSVFVVRWEKTAGEKKDDALRRGMVCYQALTEAAKRRALGACHLVALVAYICFVRMLRIAVGWWSWFCGGHVGGVASGMVVYVLRGISACIAGKPSIATMHDDALDPRVRFQLFSRFSLAATGASTRYHLRAIHKHITC